MSSILLASDSFLRKFIIEQAKLPHRVVAADIDETTLDHLPISERVVSLAEAKCKKVASFVHSLS